MRRLPARRAKAEWQFHVSCFILGAAALATIPGYGSMVGTLSSLVHDIAHGDVTGRVNIVNWPPYRCAAHPYCATARKRVPPRLLLWDGINQDLVQVLGESLVETQQP